MMNLQLKNIEELKPAPYNPRIALTPDTPAYNRLKRSLEEFGTVQPIVWNDQTGHVVGGHQRLEILKNQGVEEIEVVVVSLSLEREKLLNVALNNQQIGSDWDPVKLTDLLVDLDQTMGVDATLTGFDRVDIESLLLTPQPIIPEPEDEDNDGNQVVVKILVPPDDWEQIRPKLDELIATHSLEVHIDFPSS